MFQVKLNDGLPDKCCLTCATNLEFFNAFKEKCLTSQARFAKTEMNCNSSPSSSVQNQNSMICQGKFFFPKRLSLNNVKKRGT